jgi:DNA-binding XRE family transcriptional regulator
MVGIIAGEKGSPARATPNTILDFCGEDINWRNPGHAVDAFFKALDRLLEIGVISDAQITEPQSRIKGYFKEWLETPITITLSEKIWRIQEKVKLPTRHRRMPQRKHDRQQPSALVIPESAKELTNNPRLIRQFRADYYLHQAELARTLGVSRQTLSRYERGLRALSVEKALIILQIWKKKAKTW